MSDVAQPAANGMQDTESGDGYYGTYGDTPAGMFQYWDRELGAAKSEKKEFDAKSVEVVKAYIDKRPPAMAAAKHVNLFWSTVQVQKATLYARTPKVDVSRLYKDDDDDVSRVAGLMLERILNAGVEKDGSDFQTASKHGVEDFLQVGLGQVWYDYKAETGPQIDPTTQQPMMDAEGQPLETIISEDSPSKYIYWRDLVWSPCRTWDEARWIAYRTYLNKRAATERFGKETADKLGYRKQSAQNNVGADIDMTQQADTRAEIWCIYCKEHKRVYWFSYGVPEILDWKEDPLKLPGFWPCPEPLMSNTTTSRLIPKSDYAMAEDLFREINEIETRIAWLVRACKAVAVYDKDSLEIKNIFGGSELQVIAVDNWAAFAEKGGIQGQVQFLPIGEVASIVTVLRAELGAAQQALYEVLGISDIMRGASNPNETLGAQKLKAQFGASRVEFKQTEIANWVSDALRVKAAIICGHYQPETIIKESNIEATPDRQYAQQAVQLLQNTDLAQWRIQINPDTIAAVDWASEREARGEFLSSIGQYVAQILPLVQQAPEAAPLLMTLLKFGIGGFKIGKDVEGAIDQALNEMQKAAAQPKQPNPKEVADVKKTDSDTLLNQAKAEQIGADVDKTVMETARTAVTPIVPDVPATFNQ